VYTHARASSAWAEREEAAVAVLVTIRGRLRDDPSAIQKIHDAVTAATKVMALQAGDISHRVYLNRDDGRDFLGIDEWETADAVQAFSANPQIQEFFTQMFEAAPDVWIWQEPGWNAW
jgi:quinol monooxygenase YgiN